MTSAGNDIIALNQIDKYRTNQQRFYTKILTPAEVGVYDNGGLCEQLPFENFVWLLWSVKESVYKFCKRHFTGLVFSPLKITVQSIYQPHTEGFTAIGTGQFYNIAFATAECYCCIVHTSGGIYYASSIVNNGFIYTVANNSNNFEHIWWGIQCIADADTTNQSESVRHFALQRLAPIFKNAALSFTKSPAGYPILNVNGVETDTPVSFTHHGKFVAYAFGYVACP